MCNASPPPSASPWPCADARADRLEKVHNPTPVFASHDHGRGHLREASYLFLAGPPDRRERAMTLGGGGGGGGGGWGLAVVVQKPGSCL